MHEEYNNFVHITLNIVFINIIITLKEIYRNNKNIQKFFIYTILHQDLKILSVHNTFNKQVYNLK